MPRNATNRRFGRAGARFRDSPKRTRHVAAGSPWHAQEMRHAPHPTGASRRENARPMAAASLVTDCQAIDISRKIRE
jgi:hypothetical protein